LKIKELQLQLEDTLPCIISSCENSFKIQQIYIQLSPHHKEQIDQALLCVYLNKAPDIRRCPNSQCLYAGVIVPTTSCTELLECAECGTSWKDQSSHRDQKEIWKNSTNEIFSFLWKKLRTKKCPNCKIAIQKNGGCHHMTCQKCKYEFCWLCSATAPRHTRFPHFIHETLMWWIYRILACLVIFFLLKWLYPRETINNFIKSKLSLFFGWPLEVLQWIYVGLLVNIFLRVCFYHGYKYWFNPYKARKLWENEKRNRRNYVLRALSLVISYFVKDCVEISQSNFVKITIALIVFYCYRLRFVNHILIRIGVRKPKRIFV